MLKGIDISKWQGEVDWSAIKAAEDFVIIKSSEGDPDPGQTTQQYEDPMFKTNQAGARSVGILLGYYHFARPDFNAPEGEAEECFNAIGGLQENEIVCLDMETAGQTGAANLVDWAKRWLDHFQSLSGLKPLIYMSESWVDDYDWSNVYNAGYGLWVAKYGANDGTVPTQGVNTGVWPTAAIWQYTSVASAAGIHPVDADNFYGDDAAFDKYGYHAPVETPPAPPVEPTAPIAEPTPTPEPVVVPEPPVVEPLTPTEPVVPVVDAPVAPEVPVVPGVTITAPAVPDHNLGRLTWFLDVIEKLIAHIRSEITK